MGLVGRSPCCGRTRWRVRPDRGQISRLRRVAVEMEQRGGRETAVRTFMVTGMRERPMPVYPVSVDFDINHRFDFDG